MTGMEFMTAVENRLPIIVIVANNGMYGTIRMHQERHYPGRVSGTNLANPDFAALRAPAAVSAPVSIAPRISRLPSMKRSPRACRRSSS